MNTGVGGHFLLQDIFPILHCFFRICLQSKESATTTHSPRLRLRAHLGVGMHSGGKEGKRVLLRVCNVGKYEAGWQEEGLPR